VLTNQIRIYLLALVTLAGCAAQKPVAPVGLGGTPPIVLPMSGQGADCRDDVISSMGEYQNQVSTASGSTYIPVSGESNHVLWRAADRVRICPKVVTYGSSVVRFIEITDIDRSESARFTWPR
jgi:hypothetical protein